MPERGDLQLRLLAWYADMGVDAAVGDDAIDWLARGAAKPGTDFNMPQRASKSAARSTAMEATTSGQQATRAPAPAPTLAASTRPERRAPEPAASPPRAFSAPAPDTAVASARAAAASAATLDALGQTLAAFTGCGLQATAKNLCFYRGQPHARLMIVGEAPGREDDLAGAPFSGPAGEMLEKMLTAIGLTSEQVHVTNAVYWRPPGNRHPTPQELDVCQPFLERQTALVAPDVLLLLGAAAARHVTDVTPGIMRIRGKWLDATIGGHGVRTLVSLAPSYLLKAPSSKQSAWRDMLAIKAALAT